MDDKQAVKAKWILTHHCDGSYRDYPRGTVLIQDEDRHWLNFDSWAAAAEFTRNRLEEIRQVEEEISLVDRQIVGGVSIVISSIPEDEEEDAQARREETICNSRWCRILAREQAALAELKRGMRS